MILVRAVWELLLGLDMPIRGAAELATVILMCICLLMLIRGAGLWGIVCMCRLLLRCGESLLSIILRLDYRSLQAARKRHHVLRPGRSAFGDSIVDSCIPIHRSIRTFIESFNAPTSAATNAKRPNASGTKSQKTNPQSDLPKSDVKATKKPANLVVRNINRAIAVLTILMFIVPLAFWVASGHRTEMNGTVIGNWMKEVDSGLHIMDGWALCGTRDPYEYIARVDTKSDPISILPIADGSFAPQMRLEPGQYVLVTSEPGDKDNTYSIRFQTNDNGTQEGKIPRNVLLIRR